jgi:hypothetical protein
LDLHEFESFSSLAGSDKEAKSAGDSWLEYNSTVNNLKLLLSIAPMIALTPRAPMELALHLKVWRWEQRVDVER